MSNCGKRRQAEPGVLVAGVEVVEDDVEPGEPLVGVLRRVVDAMVVIPQGAERFPDVAVGRAEFGGVEAGARHRVEVVVELADAEETCEHRVAGTAVAVRRAVEVVQMRRDFGHCRIRGCRSPTR